MIKAITVWLKIIGCMNCVLFATPLLILASTLSWDSSNAVLSQQSALAKQY